MKTHINVKTKKQQTRNTETLYNVRHLLRSPRGASQCSILGFIIVLNVKATINHSENDPEPPCSVYYGVFKFQVLVKKQKVTSKDFRHLLTIVINMCNLRI